MPSSLAVNSLPKCWATLLKSELYILMYFELRSLRHRNSKMGLFLSFWGCPEAFVNHIRITKVLPNFKMDIALLQTPLSKCKLHIWTFELCKCKIPLIWTEHSKNQNRWLGKLEHKSSIAYDVYLLSRDSCKPHYDYQNLSHFKMEIILLLAPLLHSKWKLQMILGIVCFRQSVKLTNLCRWKVLYPMSDTAQSCVLPDSFPVDLLLWQ